MHRDPAANFWLAAMGIGLGVAIAGGGSLYAVGYHFFGLLAIGGGLGLAIFSAGALADLALEHRSPTSMLPKAAERKTIPVTAGAGPGSPSPRSDVAHALASGRDFCSRYRAPLHFEPIKRMLFGEPDGGILTLVKVSNPHLRPEPVTNCTARLVGIFHKIPAMNENGDITFTEHQIELPPVYLKWIEQDGGRKTATFMNDACFELAVVQDPPNELLQLQTTKESLREQYRVDLSLSPTFVIEVSDDMGRRAEHGFEISRNPLTVLMRSLGGANPPTSIQLVSFKVSDLWRAKALQRVFSFDQAVGPFT